MTKLSIEEVKEKIYEHISRENEMKREIKQKRSGLCVRDLGDDKGVLKKHKECFQK